MADECKDADNGKAAESNVRAVKLDSSRLRILERYLLEYKHQGSDLSETKFTELNVNYIKRLHEARTDYNFRITVIFPAHKRTELNVDFLPLNVLSQQRSASARRSTIPMSCVIFLLMFSKRWQSIGEYFETGSYQGLTSELFLPQLAAIEGPLDRDVAPVHLQEVPRVLPRPQTALEHLPGRRFARLRGHGRRVHERRLQSQGHSSVQAGSGSYDWLRKLCGYVHGDKNGDNC